MKAIKLVVKNIGIVADAAIPLDKPLIVLYGEIRQGKTTFLNAIKWVFGGSFPTDIIRKGETEAAIHLFLDCGTIHRTFYVARDGTTKARPILFERDGAPVRDAVAEIKKFLNPFLLDQNFLADKSELERKTYFASVFAVDTAGLDKEIQNAEVLAASTRAKLKGYGGIDLTPAETPKDLESLRKVRAGLINQHDEKLACLLGEIAKLRKAHTTKVEAVNLANSNARERSHRITIAKNTRDGFQEEVTSLQEQIKALEARLEVAHDGVVSYQRWLDENPSLAVTPMPLAPDLSVLEKGLSLKADTSAVDEAILQSEAAKVRFEQYHRNIQRQKEREADEALLKSADATVRELRAKKIAKLKECSGNSGISGLEFDEAGNFRYEGCQAGMLSTSQLMKLSSALSSLYPEGFGLDLIDRAESLGRSIFAFVDRAKAENKTILAAVVGERPAEVPAEVGVFVVERGVVK